MAWTAPRTWVLGAVLTAAQLNIDIRDNELMLSTHAHGGVAGDGSEQLSGVNDIILDDGSAPTAPGASKTRLYSVSGYPHYRAGASGDDLSLYTPTLSDTLANRPAAGHSGRTYHESDTQKLDRDTGAAWTTIVDADPVAGTAGLRTLGTGATQAAVGNHTHATVHDDQQDSLDTAGGDGLNLGNIANSTAFNDAQEIDIESVTVTLTRTGVIEACGVLMYFCASSVTGTLKLYIDGTLVTSTAMASPANIYTAKGQRSCASGARIVKIAVLNSSGAARTLQHRDYVFAGVNKV